MNLYKNRCEDCGCILEKNICSNCQESLYISTFQVDDDREVYQSYFVD